MPTKYLRALRFSKACALRFSKGILLALAAALSLTATAQPTWRFHLAFEDATGAKDTIWFVFDTTATIGTGVPDSTFGEGATPMNPNEFNVWIWNPAYDSTKTIAFPYTMFPDISAEIHAFNYQFPMIWRWDTALFRLPWLPEPGFPFDGGTMDNDFFFAYSNDPWEHSFFLGWTDSVVVQPTHPNMGVFPTIVNIGLDLHAGLREWSDVVPLDPTPNPGFNQICVQDMHGIQSIQVWTMDGRLCIVQNGDGNKVQVDVTTLPTGTYLLRILQANGSWHQARWVKALGQ
jgi:hypothetical protein